MPQRSADGDRSECRRSRRAKSIRLWYELLHSRRDRDESEIALRGENAIRRGKLLPVDRGVRRAGREQRRRGCRRCLSSRCEHAWSARPNCLSSAPRRSNSVKTRWRSQLQAAALNFKDVMNAMGLLPRQCRCRRTDRATGLALRSLAVFSRGSGVGHHVQPGDEVIARVAEGFCGRVITPATLRGAAARITSRRCRPPRFPSFTSRPGTHCAHLARMARGETRLDSFGRRRRRRRGDSVGAAGGRDGDRHGGNEGKTRVPAGDGSRARVRFTVARLLQPSDGSHGWTWRGHRAQFL